MNRRGLLARAAAVAISSALPLSNIAQRSGVETIKVVHRYEEGLRYVTGVVQRFKPPYQNPWIADVINPKTGNALGVLDRAGRYVPWYDMQGFGGMR